tara:strand:+ start:2580 stop:3224 length:645 start_codon:yes stop_codon:yes gene_type:complete
MSWVIKYKKYKKLIKELLYHYSELEFQEEVLKEAHHVFEEYQHEYAAKKNINLQELQTKNSQRIDEIVPQPKQAEVDEEGLVVVNEATDEDKEQIKKFGKVYKMIAKKIHPDKFANRLRTEEIEEKEELFKRASAGFESREWGKMLDVAEQINVKPANADELCPEIRKEIIKVKNKVEHNSNMYSWKLYQCEDNEECKELLMADFFRRLFNYNP